jgi:S-adenosyl-L-methionine hydrolase (adenosine-forming)
MGRRFITLTSDMGTTDYYVAALKGYLYSNNDEITIVDVSHDINAFDVVRAAYLVNACYREFPQGTIHIIGVDSEPVINYGPHHGSFPSVLVMDGHYFISNDNGFFGTLIMQRTDYALYRIDHLLSNPKAFSFPTKNILCKTALELLSGKAIEELASPEVNFKTALNPQPVIEDKVIKGHVLHIDSYGNAITNISRQLFEEKMRDSKFTIYLKSKAYFIDEISPSYNSVAPGERVAIFNENGLLEIAINRGASKGTGGADKLLGFHLGDIVRIEFTSAGSHHTLEELF